MSIRKLQAIFMWETPCGEILIAHSVLTLVDLPSSYFCLLLDAYYAYICSILAGFDEDGTGGLGLYIGPGPCSAHDQYNKNNIMIKEF